MSKSTYIERLTKQLSNFINNKNFESWCEDIGDDLFNKYSSSIPILLTEYFNSLNICKVLISKQIVSNGRIVPTSNGFIVELNENLSNEFGKNIYLAHEMAHTLFYKRIDNRYIHIEDIKQGSDDLEYACNRIARCLIIPRTPFRSLLEASPPIESPDFSFKTFNMLVKYFNISPTVFLIRATSDLSLWSDFLLLRLKRFSNDGIIEWRLIERYYEYTDVKRNVDIFIPYPDKKKYRSNPKKYPRLKGKLYAIIEDMFINLKYGEEHKVKIHANDFLADPLKTFMMNFKNQVFSNCIISKINYQGQDIINLLIKLR